MAEKVFPLQVPDTPYIDMKPCTDCGKDWKMSRSEYRNWVEVKIPSGMVIPKRCWECRQKRRVQQAGFGDECRKRVSIAMELRNLSEDVRRGEYSGKGYELSMILLDFAEKVEAVVPKGKL